MQIVVILHRAAERGCVLGPPKLSFPLLQDDFTDLPPETCILIRNPYLA